MYNKRYGSFHESIYGNDDSHSILQIRRKKSTGTNYYWYREDPKEPKEGGLHIGKLSSGWAFYFEAHYDKFQRYRLTSYHAWKEFLKEGFIYDEYGDFIPYEKFIKLIESTRAKGKTYKDIPEGEQLHLCDEWEDCGFMFSFGDFC